MPIPRLRLGGPAGPDCSALVYGTWRLLNDATPPTPRELCTRLQRCADLGITTIDTAEIYGLYRVEEALGAALALDPSLRQRLQIITKAGIYIPNAFHPERKVAFYDARGARLIKSAEKSLRFLGVETLDCLLVHRPDWLTPAADTAEGLTRLLRDGKIRAAGASNHSASQFDTLNHFLGGTLATNQVEFSLLRMDPILDGTADQAQRTGAPLMAWSPLGGGRLLRGDDEAGQRVRAAVEAMRGAHPGLTVDQAAYAWLLMQPSRPLVILGTNKVERLEQAARAAEVALTREEWYALWAAAQGRRIP